MANKAIVYIDLLGVQKMWRQGGSGAVKNRIEEFNCFVNEQINYLPADVHREGEYTVIIAGDSVSIMCQDYDQALAIGTHLFVQAFYASNRVSHPFWLRGAVSRWHNQYLTVNTQPIQAKELQIGTQYVYEDDFLSVLALEKSGFRGMRLIVNINEIPDNVTQYLRHWRGLRKPLRYITRLTQCTYPKGDSYSDVLWMTSSNSSAACNVGCW